MTPPIPHSPQHHQKLDNFLQFGTDKTGWILHNEDLHDTCQILKLGDWILLPLRRNWECKYLRPTGEWKPTRVWGAEAVRLGRLQPHASIIGICSFMERGNNLSLILILPHIPPPSPIHSPSVIPLSTLLPFLPSWIHSFDSFLVFPFSFPLILPGIIPTRPPMLLLHILIRQPSKERVTGNSGFNLSNRIRYKAKATGTKGAGTQASW